MRVSSRRQKSGRKSDAFHYHTMSSILISKVPACNIRIDPIPTKPIKVARVVRTDRVTVFLDEHGRIYSTGVQDRFAFPADWQSQRHTNTFACLVKLGVIKKADIDEHDRQVKALLQGKETRDKAKEFEKNAAALGLKLTTAQMRKIEAAKNLHF